MVVTKDRDFRYGHLVAGSPRRLLVVTTGNTSNIALLELFETHLDAVINALGEADFLELGPEAPIVHQRRRDDPGR